MRPPSGFFIEILYMTNNLNVFLMFSVKKLRTMHKIIMFKAIVSCQKNIFMIISKFLFDFYAYRSI